jgi:hypothetical protein
MVTLVITGRNVHLRSSHATEREAELAARRLIDANHLTRELELRRLGYGLESAAKLAIDTAPPLRIHLVDAATAIRRAA